MLITIILIVSAFIFGYFVGANNPLSSVKKKIQDEAKGLLKKLPIILVPAVLLLSSCSEYGTDIKATYPGTDCVFRPMDAATRDSVAKGWLHVDSLHAGNPLVCPVMVKIEASWKQKWEIARSNGTEWVAFLLWGLAVVAIGLAIWQGNKGAGMVVVVGLFVAAIVLCWFGAGAIDWATTKEIEVTKALYDTPGALKAFWDANLLK